MKTRFYKTMITRTTSEAGQSIEEKLRQMVATNEPIDTTLITPIYTERDEGVLPQHDIRTDRWNVAQETQDQLAKQTAAMRENKPNVEPTNEE